MTHYPNHDVVDNLPGPEKVSHFPPLLMKKHKMPVQSPFFYRGKNLLQIALPMGGIGAGSICLSGSGGLQDFSLCHKPNFTALPDGHGFIDAAFALLRLPETDVTRLVEGPFAPEKIYDQGLQAQGYRKGGHEGFPRFRESIFEGEYPFGHVRMSDPKVPLEVRVTGFNPFIPLDDKNSGLPCAILEYALRNTSRKPVKYEFSYHLSHLAMGDKEKEKGARNAVIPGKGVLFSNTEPPTSESFGSACLLALNGRPVIKGMWFRGGWFDSLSALWKEVSTGRFTPNEGSNGIDVEGRNGGSILFRGKINPGQTVTHAVVIAWHFPNSNLTTGGVPAGNAGQSCCADGKECPAWHPYYAGVWKDAGEVAGYVRSHYASLRERTFAFKDALFSSTVPREVLDAVSANLAILKSPTVLRQENGNVWGWEGCFTTAGCCHGSCTHVWNYAQSLCHLFPALERTLREQELERSIDERGHVNFRAALPDGPAPHGHHAAADGQLGGILKLYRDWQISGDTAWMKSLYPKAKQSLDYCIATWDPDRRGALFEPHHNTYDIEFWGPDGMCGSIYIGALSAMSLLAGALGGRADAKAYRQLAERSARFMDKELFNGEYYQQNICYEDLRDQSFMKLIADVTEKSGETLKLLKSEGPRYQYGSGCISDGIIGGWMSQLYGVETPLDREKIRSTLTAIYRHNFKKDLSGHACCQRPGYAFGSEAGLLLCSWPRGDKPTLPFVYSDEVWTGIEYQVASHLVLEGFVKEGLAIVKAVRSRYDGHVRNPWNEYECGSYYARAMASYALLPSLAGFRYSAVEKTLWFGPKLKASPFTAFFSTATGYGTISLDKSSLTVSVIEGKLELKRVRLTLDGQEREIIADAIARPGRPARISLARK
jgi:uncharacterized protein (DUF608 family)